MVALSENMFHHPGAHGINSGTAAQRGRSRCREFAPSVRYVGSGRSGRSVSNNLLVNSNFDKLYRRQQIIEQATSVVIASWQFFGPGRIATVTLGKGLVCSNMNNAQSRSAIQSGLPTPGWGSISTDQLGYDGAGRMIGKRFFNSSNVIVGFTSAYDMSSNKLFERPLHAEERSFLYQPVSTSGNIASPVPGYDSVNRLLQYQRGVLNSTGGYQNSGGGSVTTAITLPNTDAQEAWNLDGLGNWRSLTYTPMGDVPSAQQRSHNRLNQITEFGDRPFTYDGSPGASNGNMATDSFRAYQFDALNRQIQVTMAGSTTVLGNYVFDALNRRIRKTISNGGFGGGIADGTTDCIYLGNQVMEERNPFGGSGSTDTPIRQYIWGTYIDEQIQLTTLTTLGAQNVPAGAHYLLQDLLYRAVALTSASGTIVEAYDTDAYAQTIIYTGPGPDGVWFTDDDVGSGFTYGANDMIFCGYRYDPETRLYFVRNRMFLTDADGISVGRWIQRDPIGYASGVNLYEYVGGRAVPDTPIPRHRDLGSCLDVERCSLYIERRADAYGSTLIFTAPGADGVWFTDGDVQSSYGANEIIFCGYPYV